MSTNKIDMLHGSIWKKLLFFSIPLATTSILQQFFNSADVAVLGQYAGTNALAAVGSNGAVINLIITLFVGLSIGSNVIVSTYIGRNDNQRIKDAIHTSVFLAVLTGICLAILGFFIARPILVYLKTPTEILDLAILYLRIYFAGMPFFMLYNFCSAVLRSFGDTKRPLYVMIIAGLLNVFLNLLFVIKFKMSVDGVAIATLIANAFSAICLIVFMLKEKGDAKLCLSNIRLTKKELLSIARIGIPTGLQGMMFSLSNVIVQIALNKLGSVYIAATAAALNYELLGYFLLNSFSMAAVTFIGQNYGAGNIIRCRKIVREAMILDSLVTLFFSLFTLFFAKELCGLFSDDQKVVSFAVERLYFILSFEIVSVVLEVLSGSMRALGHSIKPTVICVFGICIFRITWIYTVFDQYPSFEILMTGYPISWFITVFALIPTYFYVIKKVSRNVVTSV